MVPYYDSTIYNYIVYIITFDVLFQFFFMPHCVIWSQFDFCDDCLFSKEMFFSSNIHNCRKMCKLVPKCGIRRNEHLWEDSLNFTQSRFSWYLMLFFALKIGIASFHFSCWFVYAVESISIAVSVNVRPILFLTEC